jgi:hypothetical protein
MSFGAVFSLGSNCTPAHQIRRYFNGRPSSPFDWLVTPFSSISRIFHNDGADFCLDIAECNGGTSVFCARYGVLYHHEFRIGHGEDIAITEEKRANSRSKLLYKYDKMLSIARKTRTLFLRYGSGTDISGDVDAVTSRELAALVDVLQGKLGHSDFEVCYIRQDGYPFERGDFADPVDQCSFFSDPFDPDVLGHDAAWDELFAWKGLERGAVLV